MFIEPHKLTAMFHEFFDNEKAASVVLIVCTVVSIAIANSAHSALYQAVWHIQIGGLNLENWINDGLMAIFFLLIGLELERELYVGELSSLRKALLPAIAALGGVAVPATIYYGFNVGTPTQSGIGIPMATDIAFALGVLAILGSRIPTSLKVFLAALAVIDDLCAIIVIALFYSNGIALPYLVGALAVWALLIVLNRAFRVMALTPYLLGGAFMWFLMLKSGVHATITGVMLAFAIPFTARAGGESPSARLEHVLHKPVAFSILPIFALANTAIPLGAGIVAALTSASGLGIAVGLIVGKPVGIVLASALAVAVGIGHLPADLKWRHIIGAGMLGGIGFTMSIFIANLAFPEHPEQVIAAKTAILCASLVAGLLGLLWLSLLSRVEHSHTRPLS